MLLVLTPCLYCNVSDSWMLPNKWHRAWIGAAGMYVEIVIASICTFLWWFSEPGLLNQLCLSTMFVCSVSTMMFNANPLLRYDGYYILADVMEIPNLRQKASDDSQPQAGRLVPGIGTAGRSVSAAAQPVVLRRLHHRRGHLPLGGPVRHHLVPLQGVRALRPEGRQPDAGLRVDRQSRGHADLQSGKILLRTRKARQSETQEPQHHLGSPDRGGGVRHFLPAAVPGDLHVGVEAARRRAGVCRGAGGVGRNRRQAGRGSQNRPEAGPTVECRRGIGNPRPEAANRKEPFAP